MRLSGSPVPHAGRVEIRFNGVWGTIGIRYFLFRWHNVPEVTRVICRQLNFTDSILANGWSVFGPGTGPQWFYSYDLQCLGIETNLLNCSYRGPRLIRRSYYYDLSVVCKQDVLQASGKLSNQSTEEKLHVEGWTIVHSNEAIHSQGCRQFSELRVLCLCNRAAKAASRR